MEYRRLGSSGLQVSTLSLGSWVTFGKQIDEQKAYDCMTAAYDAGVNFFDNAEAYENGVSEVLMGKVLQRTRWRRDSYIVSSKAFFGAVAGPKPTQRGLSRKHIVEACDQALERIGLEYLDLYFCHRPDPETPIEETVFAMNELIRRGKVLYWGTSEWPADAIEAAYGVARRYALVPPTMEQPQYNMFWRHRVEHEYARLYRDIGLGTTVWSPLASGLLTGKYNDGVPSESRLNLPEYEWLRKHLLEKPDTAERLDKVRRLTTLAAEIGTTMTRLALAWCAKNPNVSTVLTGASRAAQVRDNMEALDTLSMLTDEVMQRIEVILQERPR